VEPAAGRRDASGAWGITARSSPDALVSGPDGAVWFVEQRARQIGRLIHARSTATEYPLPGTGQPGRLLAGADGGLWFTNDGWLGRISAGLSTPATGNLLRNPGFEQGAPAPGEGGWTPTPGWATTGTFTAIRYGTADMPAATYAHRLGGGVSLAWAGPGSLVSHAFQYVDLSGQANAIDHRRAAVTLSGDLGGAPPFTSTAVVTATFLAASGASLGQAQIGPVAASDLGGAPGLAPELQVALVPVGTRGVQVAATAAQDPSHGPNRAFFDNVSLALSVRSAEQPVVASDQTAPTVANVSVAPPSFQVRPLVVAPTPAAAAAATLRPGVTIGFSVSEPAHVTLSFERARRIAGCPSSAATPACTRWDAAGSVTADTPAGAASVRFDGRLAGVPLAAGQYRVTVQATDRAGNAGAKSAPASFTVVAGP
jgi:hypothetical protein